MLEIFLDSVQKLINGSGFMNLTGGQALMILVSFVLMYLAIGRGFEPLLLLPIAFGMLLTNLPMAGLYHPEIFINDTGHILWEQLGNSGGLLDYLYLGVKLGIYPPLIFLGVGCMTDFGPLIANPKSFLMGAAAGLVFLSLSSERCCLALQARRPDQLVSSAAPTARRRSLQQHSSRRTCSAQLRLRHIPTWRLSRLFSRRS